MARYHLFKATHTYAGFPYEGYSGKEVLGIDGPVETNDLDQAIVWAEKLQAFNSVGWVIIDSENGEVRHHEDNLD